MRATIDLTELEKKIEDVIRECFAKYLPAQQNAEPEKEFLSVNEVAEMLGLKPKTIYAWTHSRKIKFSKSGKVLRFKRSHILEYLEANTATTVDEIKQDAERQLISANKS